jgi:hypothetical protein
MFELEGVEDKFDIVFVSHLGRAKNRKVLVSWYHSFSIMGNFERVGMRGKERLRETTWYKGFPVQPDEVNASKCTL